MSERKSVLVTIMKRGISAQGYKHLTRFSRLVCSNLVLCKTLTLSAASIFVTGNLFNTFISCHLKKIIKIEFPELEKKFSKDFALFSKNDCLSIKV